MTDPSTSNDARDTVTSQSWFTAASLIQISLMTLSLCILVFLLMILLRVHTLLRLGRRKQRYDDQPKLRDPVTLDMAALAKQ